MRASGKEMAPCRKSEVVEGEVFAISNALLVYPRTSHPGARFGADPKRMAALTRIGVAILSSPLIMQKN